MPAATSRATASSSPCSCQQGAAGGRTLERPSSYRAGAAWLPVCAINSQAFGQTCGQASKRISTARAGVFGAEGEGGAAGELCAAPCAGTCFSMAPPCPCWPQPRPAAHHPPSAAGWLPPPLRQRRWPCCQPCCCALRSRCPRLPQPPAGAPLRSRRRDGLPASPRWQTPAQSKSPCWGRPLAVAGPAGRPSSPTAATRPVMGGAARGRMGYGCQADRADYNAFKQVCAWGRPGWGAGRERRDACCPGCSYATQPSMSVERPQVRRAHDVRRAHVAG